MKIGYIVLSHRDWPQVARFAEVMRELDPIAEVVVSHDERDADGADHLEKRGITVLRQRGGRADYSAIERWLAAVDHLDTRGGVDFIVLISGQDQLAVHPDRIKADLVASGDGWVEHFDVLDSQVCPWPSGEGLSRYFFRWRRLCGLSARWSRVLHIAHALNRIQPFVRVNTTYGALRVARRASGPPVGYRVFGGSQWHALSWRAVDSVRRQARDVRGLTEWASRTLVSDESFIQTAVLNDPSLRPSQGAKRFFDFAGTESGHPRTLDVGDLDAIIASGAWFARKVDRTTSRDLIARLEANAGAAPAV